MRKLKKFELVHIQWLDHNSFSNASWRPAEAYEDGTPMLVNSVGYVMKETDDCITICATAAFELDNFLADMTILKVAIKKVRFLK